MPAAGWEARDHVKNRFVFTLHALSLLLGTLGLHSSYTRGKEELKQQFNFLMEKGMQHVKQFFLKSTSLWQPHDGMQTP